MNAKSTSRSRKLAAQVIFAAMQALKEHGGEYPSSDLVDEIRTFTFPVVLGKGKRLFDESSHPRAFTVTHSAVSPNGLIAATYVRDGEVKTATVGGAREPSRAELARREQLKRES